MLAVIFIPVSVRLLSAVSIGGATFFSYFYKLVPMFENTHGT